jgi:hypothetical protein
MYCDWTRRSTGRIPIWDDPYHEIVYLDKGGYIVADGVAWTSWHDRSASDFCRYFCEIPVPCTGTVLRGAVEWYLYPFVISTFSKSCTFEDYRYLPVHCRKTTLKFII